VQFLLPLINEATAIPQNKLQPLVSGTEILKNNFRSRKERKLYHSKSIARRYTLTEESNEKIIVV
jgi:hypothetical protein